MKTKPALINSIILVASNICIVTCLYAADHDINFSNESTSKSILLNRSWTCNFSEDWYPRDTTWNFSDVNKTKVQGTALFLWCSDKEGDIKGELNGNILKFVIKPPDPCPKISGFLSFYSKNNLPQQNQRNIKHTDIYAEGSFKLTGHDTSHTGTLQCY